MTLKSFMTLPHINYFGKIASYMSDLWININTEAPSMINKEGKLNNTKYQEILEYIDDTKSMLKYIDEIIKCCPQLANVYY